MCVPAKDRVNVALRHDVEGNTVGRAGYVEYPALFYFLTFILLYVKMLYCCFNECSFNFIKEKLS